MKLYGVYINRSEDRVKAIIEALKSAGIEATLVYSARDKIAAVGEEDYDRAVEVVMASIPD